MACQSSLALTCYLAIFKLLLASILLLSPSSAFPVNRDSPLSCVDKTYIINLDTCTDRWEAVQSWASSNNLKENVHFSRLQALAPAAVDLFDPPFPVANVPFADEVYASQVARVYNHIKIWREILAKNIVTALVIEDGALLRRNALSNLNYWLQPLLAQLKEYQTKSESSDPIWHIVFLNQQIDPSAYGAVFNVAENDTMAEFAQLEKPPNAPWAYVISRPGANFLLTHFTYYQFPLDLQFKHIYNRYSKQWKSLGLRAPSCKQMSPGAVNPCADQDPLLIDPLEDSHVSTGPCSKLAANSLHMAWGDKLHGIDLPSAVRGQSTSGVIDAANADPFLSYSLRSG